MAFDEQLRRAVDTLSDRIEADHRQAVDEAVAAARAEARTGDLGASRRLVEAVRSIGGASSLSDTLDALVTCAGREASRVGVVLVRGETFCGWRFIGFDAAHAIEFGHAAGGVITEAVRSGAPASSDNSAPHFAALPPGQECFAAPLIMGGRIVAVLYADHGAGELWTDMLDVLAQHAARCLEALTATNAARALTERPDLPRIATRDDFAGDDGAGHDHVSHDEQAAHRYARLLVSEIKLYHETAVVAGIQERDLTLRLGGEIAHARSLYEQRVPLAVRQRTDYFHAELVRTLANGDEALLEATT